MLRVVSRNDNIVDLAMERKNRPEPLRIIEEHEVVEFAKAVQIREFIDGWRACVVVRHRGKWRVVKPENEAMTFAEACMKARVIGHELGLKLA